MRFEGRHVIVVGGTSGVGQASAQAFAREGARVSVLGRSAALGEQVAQTINDDGGEARFFAVNATDGADTVRAIESAAHWGGEPDVLYNNAGKVVVKPFVSTGDEDWQELWFVNVMTMVHTMRAVIPRMVARGKGSIVNMASVSSLTASPLESAYCTTKGACVQLTRAIAVEYRSHGLRCNAVCPGFIRTAHGLTEIEAFGRLGFPFTIDDVYASQGRLAEPDEVAAAVLFLASDEASFINGETLTLDNGSLALT
ncbi:SDR family NAD(P)-dependent oxidoreductase [Trinickia acidisoli]|uniref:SDR family NAD(P)-dependent oxidoreductase n=1 Tax=Trinickia acidisoli TaxID=2767482 RepID=UPI001A90B1B8|nr:SDR family oxidoreductase [Trinickia acidisoli]